MLLFSRNFHQNLVQNLYEEIQEHFFTDCLAKIEDCLNFIPTSADNETAVSEITSICKAYNDSFELMNTEYRRIKYFKESGQYVPPQQYIIRHGSGQYAIESGQFISLSKMFELFFQIPGALEQILSYMNSLMNGEEERFFSDRIYSYVQTDKWKHKLSHYKADDIVLPLMLYFDDFEPNNPLGPKSGKLGVVYVTLLCLPLECQFTSDNIFLALIFESVCRKVY